MQEQIIRGTILNPHADRRVELIRDGALTSDAAGNISFIGPWLEFQQGRSNPPIPVRKTELLIIPPMLDAHIHIAQWPIRGRFCEGVDRGEQGRLIAGLNRNVFPEESRDADDEYARRTIEQFRADTLAQGVIGGAAYMTAHASATRLALQNLNAEWSVGMVLMNQNCPEYLRTDESNLDRDIRQLARDFGPRCIVTDRFAVAVKSELRRRAGALASELKLPTQTHLNEQRGEKEFVEKQLYPDAGSYTDVYKRDGLFDQPCLCAHCIWMRSVEWAILRDSGCAVAHCPSSNALLGSGIMDLDQVKQRQIPWSICTDVGAGASTSLLVEMAAFLRVHHGRHATNAEEALWGVTLGAARVLQLDRRLGNFQIGKECSYIEVDAFNQLADNAENVIANNLLGMDVESAPHSSFSGADNARPLPEVLDRLWRQGLEDQVDLQTVQTSLHRNVERLEGRVRRVVIRGAEVWTR